MTSPRSERAFLSILVVTPHYPAPRFPERGAFVERLVRQWIEHGAEVSVIAPDAIPVVLRSFRKAAREIIPAGSRITRPLYMSYGNAKRGRINRFRFTRGAFVKASVRRGLRDFLAPPDVVYGKFLFRGGEAALALSRHLGIPAVADVGESWSFLDLPVQTRRAAEETIRGLAGIVCVSERLRNEMIALGAAADRVVVAPNDVDLDRFRPLDKTEARARCGLPQDRFIVGFTGHFVERKGPLRVADAITQVNEADYRTESVAGGATNPASGVETATDGYVSGAPSGDGAAIDPVASARNDHAPRVAGVYLGRGGQTPVGPCVLYAGSVPNDEMPQWLNAFDLFVLPTLSEGHCNAINEAIACGVPIITSDIDDVRGQVDRSFARLVNPRRVNEIAAAIDDLRRSPETREAMGVAALRASRDSENGGRSATILTFLRRVIEEWNDG